MANIQKKNNQQLSEHLFSPFLSIQKEMDKALHNFYDILDARPLNLNEIDNLNLAPAMDLVEDKDCYRIEVEMPGMDEKDIHVSLNENVLTIHGEKTSSKKDAQKNYLSREISYGRYERSITLPRLADGDKASASFKKGMLWISIPKKLGNSSKAHEIAIKKV